MSNKKELSCRCCGSRNVEIVLDLGKQPWGNNYITIEDNKECPKYPLELYFCHECTMAQIGYTVPKEIMFVDHGYLSGTTKSLKQHFSQVSDRILSHKSIGSKEYVLDIGGNDGTFLSFFRDKQIDVLNVDSGVKQAKISREKGVPCVNKFFNEETAEEIMAEKGKAKVIHGSGIFFHLEELHSVFKGIKTILAPDGFVMAEFIYLPDMIKNCAFDQIYHEHLLYYTLQSFNKLLSYYNLAIYHAELVPIHGGSCLAYITYQDRAKKTDEYNELINREIDEGYHKIETYQEFAKRTEKLSQKLVRILNDLKKQGKTIQALGAPVKGSTIVNYCHITEKELDCAVEINRMKCNTYMPGTKIPVYHQDEVKSPDVYLMLAWNFKDEILSKLMEYRQKGGEVLIPIPDPYMV